MRARIAALLRHVADLFAPPPAQTVVELRIDGADVIEAIRREQRRNGKRGSA